MKNHMLLFLSIVLLTVFPKSLFAGQDNVKVARQVIEMLSRGQYSEITAMFDSTMKNAAPEPRLKAIWTSLLGQTGPLQEELGNTVTSYNGYEIVVVTCKFEKSEIDVKVVFDKESKIAGLFFAPHHGVTSESGKTSSEKLPYNSKEVTFENKEANVTLAGTLTLPRTTGASPAVLLISGSGPNKRNETVAGHEIFRVLADYLTRHGIAVLRYDKRGVGESTGNYAAATTMSFASDALAGVEYLKTLSEVNHKQIGLIGHSEGAEIAPIVAAESHDVAFVVMMGGPGVPDYKIIMSQIALIDKAAGASKGSIDSALALESKLLKIARTEKDSARAAARLKSILEKENHEPAEVAAVSVGEMLSPWTREFISYDPVPALEKVKCPVLAIWGSKDLQVPPAENLPAVRNALKRGGNRHFKVMELKGLNHLFQAAKTGSPMEYGAIKEAISPKALAVVAKWIVNETGRAKR